MLIRLDSSKLFIQDPSVRFAREYGLDRNLWSEMWRRYKLLDYTLDEVCEYYELKTKRLMTPHSLRRWIWRTEIYSMAAPIVKKGARVVQSEYFGKYENDLIKELTKNISVHQNPKSLV